MPARTLCRWIDELGQETDEAALWLSLQLGTLPPGGRLQGCLPTPPRQRQPIPREVQREVFTRDGGRCVECGSDFQIQYDHVIPHSLSGADTAQNLQLLCAPCNQSKGATF